MSQINITHSAELRRASPRSRLIQARGRLDTGAVQASLGPHRNIRGGRRMATVLLAEDDADIRFLVTFKLEQAGHAVRGFGDGASALADARVHRPDLAVLDILMPGMSGLD